MTINRLIPEQIPMFWEIIKFAENKVNGTDEKTFNNLLYKLLNSKTQCFVRLNEGRQLMCLFLTEVYTNPDTQEKGIAVNLVYGFRAISRKQWDENGDYIVKFGEANGCTKFYGMVKAGNEMMMRIAKAYGFKELETRVYKDI